MERNYFGRKVNSAPAFREETGNTRTGIDRLLEIGPDVVDKQVKSDFQKIRRRSL